MEACLQEPTSPNSQLSLAEHHRLEQHQEQLRQGLSILSLCGLTLLKARLVDVVIRKNTKGEEDLSCPRAHTAIDHPAPREVSAREDVMEESGGDPGFGVLLRQQVEGKEKKWV